ncbi:hypothetical protein ACXR2T_09940 [Leucobacter sp. HY1910]
MNNMKRQAAGTKQAGVSVGGQFAASQKTEASGAGLSGAAPLAPVVNDHLRRQAGWAVSQQVNIREIHAAMTEQSNKLYDFQLAVAVKDKYPAAAKMLLEEHPDGHPTWCFTGLEDAHGNDITVSDEHEWALGDLANDAQYPGLGDTDSFAKHTVDLDAALASPPDLNRRFLDSGEYNERSFSEVWSKAQERGDLVGSVRTYEDAAYEIRAELEPEHFSHLSADEIDRAARELMQQHADAPWTEQEFQEYQDRRDDTVNLLISQAELAAAQAEEAEALRADLQ